MKGAEFLQKKGFNWKSIKAKTKQEKVCSFKFMYSFHTLLRDAINEMA